VFVVGVGGVEGVYLYTGCAGLLGRVPEDAPILKKKTHKLHHGACVYVCVCARARVWCVCVCVCAFVCACVCVCVIYIIFMCT
jgi:hypothetical protein